MVLRHILLEYCLSWHAIEVCGGAATFVHVGADLLLHLPQIDIHFFYSPYLHIHLGPSLSVELVPMTPVALTRVVSRWQTVPADILFPLVETVTCIRGIKITDTDLDVQLNIQTREGIDQFGLRIYPILSQRLRRLPIAFKVEAARSRIEFRLN